MKFSIFYTTASNLDESRRIASEAVKRKLCACVNLFPQMESFFFWQGRSESKEEVVILFKSSSEKKEELLSLLQEFHSYDCPCFFEIPTGFVSPDFRSWVEGEIS